jgi:ParB family chromosome partitioning protein
VATGEPLLVNIARIDEDPNNPRTEFPDAALDELADDIRQRGILQPIVVHPMDSAGRYRIHFGSMRLRAAKRCGIAQVPVAIRSAKHDPYAQVAENLKRRGLSPLDLARFIQGRVDARESTANIAAHLGDGPDHRGASPGVARSATGARRRTEVGPLHVTANLVRAEQAA